MPWNKGFTKETHPSVLKTSSTMKARGVDNFRAWREKMQSEGIIPTYYPPLQRNGDLAEYIGVILGDGHISKFERCERIIISCNSNNRGLIDRYARMTNKLFGKEPNVSKVKDKNNIRISLYQKKISSRLGIPTGNRSNLKYQVPRWIATRKNNLVRFLKGLFEAEGSLSIHKPTYTYNFQFTNMNKNLLRAVRDGLRILGFHPEIREVCIRLRKRDEVEKFRNLIRFRLY